MYVVSACILNACISSAFCRSIILMENHDVFCSYAGDGGAGVEVELSN